MRKYFEGLRFKAKKRIFRAIIMEILLVIPLVFNCIPWELWLMWTLAIISFIIVIIGSERAEFKKIINP